MIPRPNPSLFPPRRSRMLSRMVGIGLLFLRLVSAEAGNQNALKVGYFMDLFVQESPAGEGRTQFEPWVRALVNRAIDGGTEAMLFDTYKEFMNKLDAGRGQLWDVCPMYAYDYVRLRQKCNLEAILVPAWEAGPEAEYTIYVAQNSRIAKLEDLQLKRLNFEIGGRGELPYIWFDNQMRKVLPSSTKDPAILRDTPTALRAVLPVFFGEEDIVGCVLTQGGYKEVMSSNPQVGKFLRPLATAPKLLTHVIACRRDLAPGVRQQIIDTSLATGQKSAGAKPGSLHFEIFKQEYLENLEHQWLEYQTNSLNDANDPPKSETPAAPPETLLEARAAAAGSAERNANSASTRNAGTNPFRLGPVKDRAAPNR